MENSPLSEGWSRPRCPSVSEFPAVFSVLLAAFFTFLQSEALQPWLHPEMQAVRKPSRLLLGNLFCRKCCTCAASAFLNGGCLQPPKQSIQYYPPWLWWYSAEHDCLLKRSVRPTQNSAWREQKPSVYVWVAASCQRSKQERCCTDAGTDRTAAP